MNRILLTDLSQRERAARDKLANELDDLNTRAKSHDLLPDRRQRRMQILDLLDSDLPVDRMFQQVAAYVSGKSWDEIAERRADNHKWTSEYGLLQSQRAENDRTEHLREHEQKIAALCGLLQLDGAEPRAANFDDRIKEAAIEYEDTAKLFDKAFQALANLPPTRLRDLVDRGVVHAYIVGCVSHDGKTSWRFSSEPPPNGPSKEERANFSPSLQDSVREVDGKRAAEIVRRLAAKKIKGTESFVARLMEDAARDITTLSDGAPPSTVDIVLPELDEAVDVEIQKENLHAMQAVYFAYMLEEMRIFQVVERIVELFRRGLLPLGRGDAGDFLFGYYRKAAERITEAERRDLYQRAFGAPGGTPGADANREFNELWLRFISAVSSYARQNTVERMLRSNIPISVSQEQVRKAGRDLAANLSRNGYGIAYFAATELQQTIIEFKNVLQNPELKSSFGARDMFQVIDIVNVNYLGGARNTHRYRTQAKAGAVVIRWLANNYPRLTTVCGEVLSSDELAHPGMSGEDFRKPMENPTDSDLVNACEQWLSVAGVQEQSVEQYSQPIESPVMTSRPIDMPQAARDALSQLGVALPEI